MRPALIAAMIVGLGAGTGAVGGCGGATPPGDKVLEDARASADRLGLPLASLGARAAGLDLWRQAADRGVVTLTYGEPSCESPGSCLLRLTVATTGRRTIRTRRSQAKRCWRRLGAAWMVTCTGIGPKTGAAIVTGRVIVYVMTVSADPRADSLVGQLRLDDAPTLPAPARLTCKEYRGWSARLRATMPARLRPGCT
jgi:hypothetical protein